MLSHESELARVAEPVLAWDEDGFCLVVDEADPTEAETEVSEYLSLRLGVTADGRQVIFEEALEDGSRFKQFVDIAALQFGEMPLVVVAGPARVSHRLAAACFSRLRGGFALFVSLVSVYVALGFSVFKGVASRWAIASGVPEGDAALGV